MEEVLGKQRRSDSNQERFRLLEERMKNVEEEKRELENRVNDGEEERKSLLEYIERLDEIIMNMQD